MNCAAASGASVTISECFCGEFADVADLMRSRAVSPTGAAMVRGRGRNGENSPNEGALCETNDASMRVAVGRSVEARLARRSVASDPSTETTKGSSTRTISRRPASSRRRRSRVLLTSLEVIPTMPSACCAPNVLARNAGTLPEPLSNE